MSTDINVSQLVINKLTQAQYDEAKNAGNISDTELYLITDDLGSPGVDPSALIDEHNVDPESHKDIRQAISAAANEAQAAQEAADAAADAVNDKAPMYSYGTTDLTAGTSPLESGKLYFVYE